jgi:hypothetical protein
MADDWIAKAEDQELIDALCDVEKGLDEWEMGFVDSLGKNGGAWAGGTKLSPKQRAKAEAILRRLE